MRERCLRQGCNRKAPREPYDGWVQLKVTSGSLTIEGMACPEHWDELLDHPERGRQPEDNQE